MDIVQRSIRKQLKVLVFMHNKIKTPKEISNNRRSGSILEHVIQFVVQYTKPGMSTKKILLIYHYQN